MDIQNRVRARFVAVVGEVFSLEINKPALAYPPSVDLGELSITSCFELAKQLRQPPRKIAEQLATRLLPIEGVERVAVAGAGYLNLYFDRASLAADLFRTREVGVASGLPREGDALPYGKILVEHTSINPNKAAHIGHLRNAVLGDAFVRLLRFRGHTVEVENYIDNTGVQVADVVVGFVHLEKKTVTDVRRLIDDPAVRFDYYCWDLYARVFQYYEVHEDALALRADALKSIEEGHGDLAAMADLISTAVVRTHLETMRRINVEYDLLVQESEILRLDFWKSAFELMKKIGAIRFEDAGKNRGCWVMSLDEGAEPAAASSAASPESPEPKSAEEDVKVIVRSNGTVTYVGKDIAYHLWKFGLLGKDFGYERFYVYPDGHPVWRTSLNLAPPATGPAFGKVAVAYAVIDTRQSYVQNVVRAAFHALGYHEQAANLHHFAYEVVGLSPRCAEEMGLKVDHEDREKGYIEVSGRKGLGIKADDLIQQLIEKAAEEVGSREMTKDPAEQNAYATMIAVGALRYFLLKFTRRSIIAFDFKEALAFEGETGPYLQYSVVRARNIFRKFEESHTDFKVASLGDQVSSEELKDFLAGDSGRSFWEMTLLAAQLEVSVDQAIEGEEPAVVAKYAFRLAQAFNNFYHHHHILNEPDSARQRLLLYLVHLVSRTLASALDLLGTEVPEKM
ncbi:MAG TPA: arginine--tRNA ligase [Terriglobia bacterium]|nr:arginine--tRNA ligase [Terriglobia bacterium]